MTTTGFNTANPEKPTITKDPDAVLDYAFDWAQWVCDDDTLADLSTSSTGSLVVESTQIESELATPGDPDAVPPVEPVPAVHKTTAIVSGGTPGQTESVTFHVTTTQGRIDDRTMFFKVKER